MNKIDGIRKLEYARTPGTPLVNDSLAKRDWPVTSEERILAFGQSAGSPISYDPALGSWSVRFRVTTDVPINLPDLQVFTIRGGKWFVCEGDEDEKRVQRYTLPLPRPLVLLVGWIKLFTEPIDDQVCVMTTCNPSVAMMDIRLPYQIRRPRFFLSTLRRHICEVQRTMKNTIKEVARKVNSGGPLF